MDLIIFVNYKDYQKKQEYKKQRISKYKKYVDTNTDSFMWVHNKSDYLKKLEVADLLIFDEFQFICGKSESENALAEVFKERLKTLRKTIIISDIPKNKLPLGDSLKEIIESAKQLNIV